MIKMVNFTLKPIYRPISLDKSKGVNTFFKHHFCISLILSSLIPSLTLQLFADNALTYNHC